MLKGDSASRPSVIPSYRFSIHISYLPASQPDPLDREHIINVTKQERHQSSLYPQSMTKTSCCSRPYADPRFSREKDSGHGGVKTASICAAHLPASKEVLVAEAAAQHKTEKSPGAVYSFTAEVSFNQKHN